MDDLVDATGLDAAKALVAATELELEGLAVREAGRWRRSRGP